MDQVERIQWQRFQESGVGDLWKWLVGGWPMHLGTGLTGGVIDDFFRMLVEIVEDGCNIDDLLKLREQLKWRLMQEAAGRRRRGPR
jgi:hypothetical protein